MLTNSFFLFQNLVQHCSTIRYLDLLFYYLKTYGHQVANITTTSFKIRLYIYYELFERLNTKIIIREFQISYLL